MQVRKARRDGPLPGLRSPDLFHATPGVYFSLDIVVEPMVSHKLVKGFTGPRITNMDTRKYMLRMIARGLLRHPTRGLRSLLRDIRSVEAGSAGRKSVRR